MKPSNHIIRNINDKYTEKRPSFATTYAEYNGGHDESHDPADYYRNITLKGVRVG